MDRFKFRAYIKYAKLLEDIDSFFIDNLKEKITLHFSNCHTKTMKLSDCILEQCTGLKDKNGKLIYEGDIVKGEKINRYSSFFNDYVDYYETEVKWFINGFNLDPHIYKYTIIGNIHENPKLLEDK